ncbi:acetaldehyde dehydrogenase (acetylating) [Ferrimonas balearica]|uniref:acetaldehyde dehydrogenase (acetylating) n=1 Tax=Ferrimonas balearica TaxID=44012 RepID=UPI001C99C1B1|nr:acetaldehyde dehydrogenase (acetylating) [Ferrimonas balearica]MBY5991627.1 acetaldehyde dehydrogenase (acetylating) [Ferrimonas balearica]
MSNKLKAAILGPGNIGTDLLLKMKRSEWIEPVWMVGVDPDSPGLERARQLGINTTAEGLEGLLPRVRESGIQLAFDATSAAAHAHHAQQLNALGVVMVDLTPAALGPFCVPPVNLDDYQGAVPMNLNMVTCGGQATIPMVKAVSRVQPVRYGEIIATVASRSVGPGTRQNIDEFTRTTALGVERIGGAAQGKAIIIINPAEPPLIMRDTVHCLTEGTPDRTAITESVQQMLAAVQRYVPGYRLVNGPVFDGQRVSLYLEVEGLGDHLPKYAGNLDIMTAAALETAESLARGVAAGRITWPNFHGGQDD